MKIEIDDERGYPTVGEMLQYIEENEIPMDAVVTCEQLKDYYLEDRIEDDYESWDYYISPDECFEDKLIPIHNGFGSAFDKKLFVMWMHY